jgi:hypothetical protein
MGGNLNGFNILDTRNKNRYGLGVEISMFFYVLLHYQLNGDETTMYNHDLHNIRYYLTQETEMYMV